MMKYPLATILMAAGMSAVALTPAHAAISRDKKVSNSSVVINVTDLDLDTRDGVRSLENRVAKAVRQVCRVVDIDTGYRTINRDTRNCLAKARASADRQVAALVGTEQRGG